jgi:CBS domain-containing protein
MSVGRICQREVDLVDGDETAQEAARRMRERGVGTLVVLDAAKRPLGIVTDRDLALRIVADAKDPTQTPIAAVMVRMPRTIAQDAPIESALALMKAGPYRRLPVVDENGALCGIVSLDDVLQLLAEELALIGKLVEREEPGR